MMMPLLKRGGELCSSVWDWAKKYRCMPVPSSSQKMVKHWLYTDESRIAHTHTNTTLFTVHDSAVFSKKSHSQPVKKHDKSGAVLSHDRTERRHLARISTHTRETLIPSLIRVRNYLNNYFDMYKRLTRSRICVELASPAYLGLEII